jgi:MarR family multiple antibiotic resistance transcriptional regulator
LSTGDEMTPTGVATEHEAAIRQLLNRRDLASARHRAAISRQLGLSDSEMFAVAHLAQHGQLSPSALGELLEISSSGITALIQRLENDGHVVRRRHPTDGRSVLVQLTPQFLERAELAFGPLVRDLDQVSHELDEDERTVVLRYLDRVTSLSEAHAERARKAIVSHTEAAAAPAPGLWG